MAGQPPVRQIAKVNVAALAREYSSKSLEKLGSLLDSTDERVVMEAATRLLDRGFGKPSQTIENGESGAFEIIQRIERVVVDPSKNAPSTDSESVSTST